MRCIQHGHHKPSSSIVQRNETSANTSWVFMDHLFVVSNMFDFDLHTLDDTYWYTHFGLSILLEELATNQAIILIGKALSLRGSLIFYDFPYVSFQTWLKGKKYRCHPGFRRFPTDSPKQISPIIGWLLVHICSYPMFQYFSWLATKQLKICMNVTQRCQSW